MRSPVEVERHVTLTLYYLSDEGRLRKTANAFGLARACVSITITSMAYAITNQVGAHYVNHPTTEEEVNEKVTNFFHIYSVWVRLMALISRSTVVTTSVEIGQV